MSNLNKIISSAQNELQLLKAWMPESFEMDDYQSPYEILTSAQAEGAYQTIKALNVYPVGEIIPEDLKLYEYGEIKTRWSPVDQLGTALEWVSQFDVNPELRIQIIKYLKGEISDINIQSFFS